MVGVNEAKTRAHVISLRGIYVQVNHGGTAGSNYCLVQAKFSSLDPAISAYFFGGYLSAVSFMQVSALYY